LRLLSTFLAFLRGIGSTSPLEKQIKYTFRNKQYLTQAFTHKSLNTKPCRNYERLEFLGDAVLDIIVSRELLREFPEGDEGLLTQKRAALVQKPYLAQMGTLLHLMDYLQIESGVDLSIEKIAEKQLANIYESLIGAIYLDGGLIPCRELILNTVWSYRNDAWKATNFKGRLIEYCHSKEIDNPNFLIKDISGPDHQRTFEVHVKIGKQTYPSGLGTNKKTAEQRAAKMALEEMNVIL
tara:strand:- start:374 stop:1087 length:714 start_codon:yes stop_codon:yes gene_type:complete